MVVVGEIYSRGFCWIQPLCGAAKCLHIQCKSRGIGRTSIFLYSVTVNRDLQYIVTQNGIGNDMLKCTFNRHTQDGNPLSHLVNYCLIYS